MNLYTVEVTTSDGIVCLIKTSASHQETAGMQACEEMFESTSDLTPDDDEYNVDLSIFSDDCQVRVWDGHHDETPVTPSIYP
jgi:hypothetical protein